MIKKEAGVASMDKIKKQHDAKFDIVKFILSFFVVAIHSGLFPYALYPWLRIAVPMFFMMTSYFLFSALGDAPKEKQLKIIKKFVLRNVKLYLCWFVVLLPFTLYIFRDDYLTGLSGLKNFLKDFAFGGTFVASWYITASIIGVVLIYFLSRLLRFDIIVFIVSLVAFWLVTLESSYSVFIDGTFIGYINSGFERVFVGMVFSFPASLIWIFMGKLFAQGKIRHIASGLLLFLLIVSCVGLSIEWRYVMTLENSVNNDSYFMLLPVCVLLFAILMRIPSVTSKNSLYLKHASTVIYVTHGSILSVFDSLARKLVGGVHPLISFFAASAISLLILVLLEVLNRAFKEKRIGKVLGYFY